jgi:hypothetical protein
MLYDFERFRDDSSVKCKQKQFVILTPPCPRGSSTTPTVYSPAFLHNLSVFIRDFFSHPCPSVFFPSVFIRVHPWLIFFSAFPARRTMRAESARTNRTCRAVACRRAKKRCWAVRVSVLTCRRSAGRRDWTAAPQAIQPVSSGGGTPSRSRCATRRQSRRLKRARAPR